MGWRQKVPSSGNTTSKGPQVKPPSMLFCRRTTEVNCMLSLPSTRSSWAVYIAQTSPLGARNNEGFCSLRRGSPEIITGSLQRAAPLGSREQITLISALPS